MRTALLVALGCFVLASGAGAREPLVQGFELRVPVPPVAVPVSGTPRIVYELHLANFGAQPLEPAALEVLDAATGAVLERFSGGELGQRLYRPGADDRSRAVAVPPGAFAVAYVELDVPQPPDKLRHRLEFHSPGEVSRAATTEGAAVPVGTERPLVAGPPLSGGPWAAVYHPAWERGHRRFLYAVAGRAVIPGRYAVDWIRLDAEGRMAGGDSDRVANWHGYGAEVLAVADGIVARRRDDVAESATLSAHPRHPLEDATGNYVVLDVGRGRYVFYEHLKPGSVRVRVGDRVQRGEPIAALGFTGHSTGPHLHFHVADGLAPLGSEGLPFVIDAFEVIGGYAGPEGLTNRPWSPPAEGAGGRRSAERPAPNAVLRFP